LKEILKAINTKLIGDTTLKTLLGYTSSNKNIKSFESLKKYHFDKMLLFGKLTASQLDESLDTSKVREYDMQIQALDKINNINVMDITERVITLLHNFKLEETGIMRSLKCEFERSLPCYYDNEIKMYVEATYFNLIVAKLN